MKVFTIGAYGWTEDDFAHAVRDADPDVFVDVRGRRGLRGHDYAWANSNRLQTLIADLSVLYVHRPDVAPSDATRRIEVKDAATAGIGYRERTSLSQAYLDAYGREVLEGFDAEAFVTSLGDDVGSIVLFCVEQAPAACHRSLVAQQLADELGADVVHILPPER